MTYSKDLKQSHEQELACIWRQLSNTQDYLSKAHTPAERHRLNVLAGMLRTEYNAISTNFR